MSEKTKPHWENKYPGRLKFELDALEASGAKFDIQEDQLSKGRLALDVLWTVSSGSELSLYVEFPDSYPWMRPHVQLQSEDLPSRHCSPIDGTLCLLGRDSAQWQPSMTVAGLLADMLEDALSGKGEQDPQGEPDEFWWKVLSQPRSFILVDSDKIPDAGTKGHIKLRFLIEKGDIEPKFCAFTQALTFEGGSTQDCTPFAVPRDLGNSHRTIDVPFVSIEGPLPPQQGAKILYAFDIIKDNFDFERTKLEKLTPTINAKFFAISYESELQFEQTGRAWLFFIVWGSRNQFKQKNRLKIRPIVALRAGSSDIGVRVPGFDLLQDCKIGLFGIGALGAPLAIELARNGANGLTLVDKDTVEPGNSVRWPIGCSSWNVSKAEALFQFISSEYPYCIVKPRSHPIGGYSGEGAQLGDREALEPIADTCDLLVDATASFGPQQVIAELGRKFEKPVFSVYGTAGLKGGAACFFHPKGGCPICLEHHYHDGNLLRPNADDAPGIQPVGCSEVTFRGSSFDLSEIGAQCMRLIRYYLSNKPNSSLICSLDFCTEGDGLSMPKWNLNEISVHDNCTEHG